MKSNILILDGGLGTSLIRDYGVVMNSSMPLWSSHLLLEKDARETLLRCQKGFGDVPVDIMLTATYQLCSEALACTFPNSSDEECFGRGTEVVEDAVRVVEEAKQVAARIALSMGPYGATAGPGWEYTGQYDEAHDSVDALQAWHSNRLELFASVSRIGARVSFLAFETIPRLDEIKAIRKAVDTASKLAGIPFWMTCNFPGDDKRLPDGSCIGEIVKAMLDPDAAGTTPWGIGINCTQVFKLDSLLQEFEAAVNSLLSSKITREWPALVLYPDGTNGEVFNTREMAWEMPSDLVHADKTSWEQQVADVVRSTESRGHWKQIVVGGCCQSNAGDIKRLRQILEKIS